MMSQEDWKIILNVGLEYNEGNGRGYDELKASLINNMACT
jgi:hypothetical protein